MEIIDEDQPIIEADENLVDESDVEPNLKTEACDEVNKNMDISSMGDGNLVNADNANILSNKQDEYDWSKELEEFKKGIFETFKTQLEFLERKIRNSHNHVNYMDVGFKNIQQELNSITERNDVIEQSLQQLNQLFKTYKQFLEEELPNSESAHLTHNKKIESSIHSLERRVESWQCLLKKNGKEMY